MNPRVVRVAALAAGVLVGGVGTAAADDVAQPLPLRQSWTDTSLLDRNDDWSLVPGIQGRRGALVDAVDVDPRTVLADAASAGLDVRVNRNNANGEFGGLIELEVDNPTVALQATGVVSTPHLTLAIITTAASYVRVQYDLVDVDGAADDVAGEVALQWRPGNSGPYLDVPGAFVADATEGGAAGRRTHVDVLLPDAASDLPRVQLRVLVTDHTGQDEWIGVDDIEITASTAPTGTGLSVPDAVAPGLPVRLEIAVEPGTAPASSGIAVQCDLTAIGGVADLSLFDDDTTDDDVIGDGRFTRRIAVRSSTAPGLYQLPCDLRDAEGRTSSLEIALTVLTLCGDRRVEAAETCDDGNTVADDGCDGCAVTAGWTCSGAPSVCADIDECAEGGGDCAAGAGCANLPGSYQCWCADGWEGDGRSDGSGCTDVDECTAQLDDCAPLATCSNSDGGFACTCPAGYTGDGQSDGTGCADVDECSDGSATCSPFATCGNLAGSYVCACGAGFTGDGRVCSPQCGDGLRILDESCDDGNTSTGDGCDASCQLEDGFSCMGQPTTCIADRDADGVPDLQDNCPDAGNPDQTDDDDDGVGAVCDEDDEPAPPPEKGGCLAAGGAPTGPAGATLLALLGLRVGRRRARRRS